MSGNTEVATEPKVDGRKGKRGPRKASGDSWVILHIAGDGGVSLFAPQLFATLRLAKAHLNTLDGKLPGGSISFARTKGNFKLQKRTSVVFEAV